MDADPHAPHASSPAEIADRLAAERAGVAFLAFRDATGKQRIVPLLDGEPRLTVGRSLTCDIALDWDDQVSRQHAELEYIGGHWTVVDDGRSRNGTFLDGARVSGRRRLSDGSRVRFGTTVAVFRVPAVDEGAGTVVPDEAAGPPPLSEAQRRVLVALCRPYRDGDAYAVPATNRQIAADVVLSVDGVKTHLRALFAKFGLDDVPANEKRIRLVERARQTGAVTSDEL
jgi:predicted component of type VI protein secretion system